MGNCLCWAKKHNYILIPEYGLRRCKICGKYTNYHFARQKFENDKEYNYWCSVDCYSQDMHK